MTPPRKPLVVLESPYAGTPADVQDNILYARQCVLDSLQRGEAPMASHILYTQPGILDDTVPEQRARGIAAGLSWLAAAERSVVYVDRGITPGMRQGIAAALARRIPVHFRSLFDFLTASAAAYDFSGKADYPLKPVSIFYGTPQANTEGQTRGGSRVV